jgi:peptidoglycan/xylan/chitin deacetylase (PgdA/CDA1 family)
MRGFERVGAACLVIAAAASAGACIEQPTAPRFDYCTGAQALTDQGQDGEPLAAGTLALTFDQGPGQRTWELSDFLHAQGIRATFFVNGKNVDGHEWALGKLMNDGHLVANLTESNAALTDMTTQEIIDAVAQTDARIAPFVPGGKLFLRAPYSAWTANERLALEGSPMKKYLGPVGWDIGGALTEKSGADFQCWDDDHRFTPESCGDLYFQEIQAKKKGVVLMHDGPLDVDNGPTVDMVKYLVPKLKAAGFVFVRVDEIPVRRLPLVEPPLESPSKNTAPREPTPPPCQSSTN